MRPNAVCGLPEIKSWLPTWRLESRGDNKKKMIVLLLYYASISVTCATESVLNLYVQYNIVSERRHKVKKGANCAVFKMFNKFKSHTIILGFKVLNRGSDDGNL